MVALIAAAGIAAAGGLASAGVGASGAKSAGAAQASAQREASQLQEKQYEQTRADLMPYNEAGQSMLPALTAYPDKAGTAIKTAYDAAQANIPGTMTQAQLEATPGYQWSLSQGLKAVQNSAAARGLGVSSAAMDAGSAYATGLANQTYKDQFAIAQQRYQDYNQQFANQATSSDAIYKYLMGSASLGENAAAQAGNIGQAGAAAAGSNIAGAGQATAAGIAGASQATAGGLQSASNAPLNYLAYSKLFNGTSYGGGSSVPGGNLPLS